MSNLTTKQIFKLVEKKSDYYGTSIRLDNSHEKIFKLCNERGVAISALIQLLIDNNPKKELEKIKTKLKEKQSEREVRSVYISRSSFANFKDDCKEIGIEDYSAVLEYEFRKILADLKK